MDDALWVLIGGSLVLYLLVGPALGIAAFAGSRRAQRQVELLSAALQRLNGELAALRRQAAPEPQPPETEAAPPVEPEAPRQTEPASPDAPEASPAPTQTAAAQAAVPPSGPRLGIEQWLTSRGLIWLGGITLALAGLFLAKYTYDHGWLALGPAARCAAGFLFGLALTAGGEWLRRRPLQRAVAALGPNYLPPALTAAGLASGFASVYAAYGLYALLPPLAAFALLALVAFAAFGLALLQGPFIAALALLGGFVTPLLVSTAEPFAWGLFPYLLAIAAAALAVTRYVGSWWLAWGTLAGAALWPLLWFAALWSPGDAAALGSYILLLAGLFLALRYRSGEALGGSLLPQTAPDRIAWGGALATALLAFALVRMDDYGPLSLATVFLLVALYLAAGWREAVFEGLVLGGALLSLAVVALWHLPAIADWPQFTHRYRHEGYAGTVGPVVPPELADFVLVCFGFGALFAAVGFLALARAGRPALWAGVSAALPVLLLALAYWRVTGLGVDLAWSAVAAGVALLCLAAAAAIRRRPPRAAGDRLGRLGGESANDLLLGIYALGGIAAVGLAFAMALQQAWLTVALSLLLPAIAWVSGELGLRSLRPAAFVVAAVVLVRLVLNYNVLDYPLGSLPGLNWILYGYGVPALAFWWAARRFRRQDRAGGGAGAGDSLVLLLEGGALALVWLLVTGEIRSLVAGDLASRSYGLAEQSLQTVTWLAMAYGWLRAWRRSGRVTLLWGWRLLAGLAALHSPLFQLFYANPIWTYEPVGDWPLVNLLALAYLLPGFFALAFAWELRRDGYRKSAMVAAVYALLLVFVYLSLEVRRAFHGPVLSLGTTGDGELLTYSLVWLGYAWLLFVLGLRTGYASLRYASLAVLGVATGKVLLFDWGSLEGLYRFASFAVLGFSLLGIPFLYQRLVFPPRPAPLAAPPAAHRSD
ncbi:MAG: DUF2339 domain-containing protein [Kiloniellaceae bacterium]